MTDPNTELLVELKKKINLLIEQHQGLKHEVLLLEKEKQQLTDQLEKSAKEYSELEKHFNNLKLTKELVSGSEEASGTKKRIDQIVREIDNCIALLNR